MHATRPAAGAVTVGAVTGGAATPIWDRIGRLAEQTMLLELFTHPKPGLVSHVDSGSHRDMDAATFRASAAAIRPFLAALAQAGGRLAPIDELRCLGIAAEAAMLRATGGVNTHRGAIFGLGLLAAAAGARASGRCEGGLGRIVATVWGDAIGRAPLVPNSHGTEACRRHGVGGARAEAASGFGTIRRVGSPALREGRLLSAGDDEAARVQCLFALIATVDDTALLHRGGAAGRAFARVAARGFLRAGGVGRPDWRDRALHVHRQFVARDLSPGGCADLLAMTLFVAMVADDVPPAAGCTA